MSNSSPQVLVASIWQTLRDEAVVLGLTEPALAPFVTSAILDRGDFGDALSYGIALALAELPVPEKTLRALIKDCHEYDADIVAVGAVDLAAVIARDPAVHKSIEPFLFFKGYQALQAWRVSHWFWQQGRNDLGLYLQSRIARRYDVDIHPAAQIGQGIMFDHAHGIVIGETTIIEDNVSFLHNVTLGGTGKQRGDRHPKIRSGVMIGAGAKILGNIEVGRCARVAAGSVVLENVPPNVTVAGAPARIVGEAGCEEPAALMDQNFL